MKEDFEKIIERCLDDECSMEEKEQLLSHIEECEDLKEELLFAQNIKNTLRSLPKIEVPDNFLVSLNEKLDKEDIKVSENRKSAFVAWKKYSALAACLLLAVMLRVDVWDMSKMPENTSIVVETQEVARSEEGPAEEIPKSTEEPQIIEEPQNIEAPTAEESSLPVAEKTVLKAPKEKESKPTPTVKPAVADVKEPEKPADKTEETSHHVRPTEVINMPTVALPAYMDSRDDIVIVPEKAERVRFDDYEIVVTDEFLEAFSLAAMPENKVIVASPGAMNSVQTLSLDTTAYQVPTGNFSAGSGTLFVSARDEERVQSILNKYSLGEDNKTFMLSSSNYNSFIDELKNEGINYQDYMISTAKTNVAFTLIVS